MNRVKELTMFFPCYNDAHTIGALVQEADAVASQCAADYEILVIDDGSRDASAETVRSEMKRLPKLRLISHGENRGYGAALRTGFREASKELVFYTDGDGQYDVKELKGMLQAMEEGVDMVNGYKIQRNDPWPRVLLGWLYLSVTRFFFRFRVRDLDCDFRLIRKKVLDAVDLRLSSGAICLELVKKAENAGFRIVDHPVHHGPRRHGHSQFFSPGQIWGTLTDAARLGRELRRPGGR